MLLFYHTFTPRANVFFDFHTMKKKQTKGVKNTAVNFDRF